LKLGLLTAPFPDTSLDKVADWAASEGFEALEIACWPKSVIIEHEDRRFEGSDEAVKRGFLLARDVLKPLVK
jgi:hypothetical protein